MLHKIQQSYAVWSINAPMCIEMDTSHYTKTQLSYLKANPAPRQNVVIYVAIQGRAYLNANCLVFCPLNLPYCLVLLPYVSRICAGNTIIYRIVNYLCG